MPDNTIRVADWLADDWGELQHDPTFVAEDLILDVALQIAEAMEEAGFETQKELADELDVSKSAVSQLLSGDQNVSLKRLVKVALALGKNVEVNLVDRAAPEIEPVRTRTKRVDVEGEAETQSSSNRVDLWLSETHGDGGRGTSDPSPRVQVNGKPVSSATEEEDAAA